MAMSSLVGWDIGGRPAVYCYRSGYKYWYLTLIILFNITPSFEQRKMVPDIVI